ncbi:MAG TPA: FAD-dependent oxidoreductase [Chthoniobacteraceae bacterium]|jgi:hypothetical protein|nr:FAD-dependent oxidoreductase [Chthoniobacteraceae bacterium]
MNQRVKTYFALYAFLCVLCALCGQSPAAESTPNEERDFDLVVVEATPGGIAMAVRAAREGLRVLLVNHNRHLGGILSSGLGVWDTLWEGKRSPVYDETRQAIFDYYRTTYGEDSPQYRDSLPGKSGHTNGKFEAHVAEQILTGLVTREKNITVLPGYYPAEVTREGALMMSVTFRELDGTKTRRISAKVFADCSYEGDLAAVAKVPYRLGREARDEFKEPHAGVVYMQPVKEAPTTEMARAAELHDRLNLRKFRSFQVIKLPESTGEADGEVQAFNYRTSLSSDPAKRVMVEKPAHYDSVALQKLEYTSVVAPIPNQIRGWNRPQLVGPHTAYVEGDWAVRRQAMDQHWEATVALLYYLQHEPAVPEEVRKSWAPYGLATEEFADHGRRPYEFYVREGRRIIGRSVFTEHDATLAPGLPRAPVQADSVAVTEWYMDAHACTPGKISGCLEEGKMMLDVETFPGQVSYRTLLPKDLDNLLVPICLSSTHVAWGTIRLEPTWMNIAESAALAAVQAIRNHQMPAQIDTDRLLRTLAEKRVMIAFFNDVDIAAAEPWISAVQYFGTKGFFHDYNARAAEPLKTTTGVAWAEGLRKLRVDRLDPMAQARAVTNAEAADAKAMTRSAFAALLPPSAAKGEGAEIITRGEAMTRLFQALPRDAHEH